MVVPGVKTELMRVEAAVELVVRELMMGAEEALALLVKEVVRTKVYVNQEVVVASCRWAVVAPLMKLSIPRTEVGAYCLPSSVGWRLMGLKGTLPEPAVRRGQVLLARHQTVVLGHLPPGPWELPACWTIPGLIGMRIVVPLRFC